MVFSIFYISSLIILLTVDSISSFFRACISCLTLSISPSITSVIARFNNRLSIILLFIFFTNVYITSILFPYFVLYFSYFTHVDSLLLLLQTFPVFPYTVLVHFLHYTLWSFTQLGWNTFTQCTHLTISVLISFLHCLQITGDLSSIICSLSFDNDYDLFIIDSAFLNSSVI